MRLEPIEQPTTLMMRLAYWMTRRQLGKVLTTMKVLYPRVPGLMKLSWEITKFETRGIRLEPAVHYLIAALVSQINRCDLCVDLTLAMAMRQHLDMDKFAALSEYRTSPRFSDRERAALQYVEEITRRRHVSDATFDALRENFKEWEIVEITWLNAVHNYYNLINVPLGIESDGLCSLATAGVQ